MWCPYNELVRGDGSMGYLSDDLMAGKTELGLSPLTVSIAPPENLTSLFANY